LLGDEIEAILVFGVDMDLGRVFPVTPFGDLAHCNVDLKSRESKWDEVREA